MDNHKNWRCVATKTHGGLKSLRSGTIGISTVFALLQFNLRHREPWGGIYEMVKEHHWPKCGAKSHWESNPAMTFFRGRSSTKG